MLIYLIFMNFTKYEYSFTTITVKKYVAIIV